MIEMAPSMCISAFIIASLMLFDNGVSSFELRGEEAVATPKGDYPPELLISTTQGSIQGVYNELGVRQWKGIPYAKPPVNELRWFALFKYYLHFFCVWQAVNLFIGSING